MPVILIYGISDAMSQKLEEFTEALVNTVAYSVIALNLETSDVSVFYPKDWMAKGLREDMVIFVDGLFDRPERTEAIRNKLAKAIVKTAREFFPEMGLIECLIRPFDRKQGFYSTRSIRKSFGFPETLELGGYSKEELIDVIIGQGNAIAPQASSLISQESFVTLTEKKIVKLCRKTVEDMGFTEEFTPWFAIKDWIQENGQLCENELALRLRIVYQDQPVDEELLIANKFQFFRIANFEGKKSIFRNGVDGFQSSVILMEDDPAENDSTVYCLYNEFVYCEK